MRTDKIRKENVDLHCLIAQVIDEIYPTLSANGNTAVFTAEDNLSVNADPEKLARVFSNLLRNAASYSYPQTEITISAKRLEHDIQITFENHGKTIHRNSLTVYLKNSIAWMMLGFLIQVVRDLVFLLRKKLYIYMVERLLHPVKTKP